MTEVTNTEDKPVPTFTDEEFIAFLTEQGFWTENLIAERSDG